MKMNLKTLMLGIVLSISTTQAFSQFWNLAGNVAIGGNFLGTMNGFPLVFKTNNLEVMRLDPSGKLGIGTTTPSYQLDVVGDINLASGYVLRMNAVPVLSNIGTNNIFVGDNAGYANTTGSENTFSGYQAGYSNTTGHRNVFSGYQAGYSNNTGIYNVFSGYQVGYYNTTGSENVFSGHQAGFKNTTGSTNVYIGEYAGYSNTAGYDNVFSGYVAGYSNTTGVSNVFTGRQAGYSNTTGGYNVFTGYIAGMSNTTGNENVYLGSFAGEVNTTSSGNTSLGGISGSAYHNGDNNTFVGYTSDANAASYTNSSALGYGVTISASNQVRIGNTSITSIGGQVGWTTISDGRVKKNVQNNVPGLDFIKKLRPVTYNLDIDAIDKLLRPDALKLPEGQKPHVATQQELDAKTAKGKIVYTGFIAQEVEKAANDVGYSFSGVDAPKNDKDVYGLRYAEFTVPLIKAVQEIANENILLKQTNDSLTNIINNFNARLSALENLSKGSSSNNSATPLNIIKAYLEQNIPNPFTDNTVIKYFIPENTGNAKIVITSDQGFEVMNFTINQKGNGSVIVSGNTLQNGYYSCTLIIDGKSVDLKKMILVR